MRQKITRILTVLALSIGLLSFSSLPAAAAPVNVFNGACTKSVTDTTICPQSGDKGLFAIIKNIINIMLMAAGIIAVIMIVIGGINYSISSGDAKKIAAAKDTVLYAIIGLVVAVMAFAIVNFVLTRIF